MIRLQIQLNFLISHSSHLLFHFQLLSSLFHGPLVKWKSQHNRNKSNTSKHSHMGNSPTPISQPQCRLPSPLFTCSQPSLLHHRNTSASTFSHVGLSNALTLQQLRQSLCLQECFYVLSSLLLQFYQIYKRNGRVVVWSGMCCVNALGEVKVTAKDMEGSENIYREEAVSNSLVSLVSHILEIVQSLAKECQWLENRDCAFFHESILKLIYRHHSNEDLLYYQLTAHINAFMEFHNFRCNLLAAILRINSEEEEIPQPQENFLQRKRHRRYDSQSIESFARRDSDFFKDTNQLSQTVFTKNQASTKYSHNQPQFYRQKQVLTDLDQSHLSPTQPPPSNHRNFISAQYSMNIASCHKQEQTGKSKVRFKKYAHKLNYDAQPCQRSMKRNKTTANLHHKSHTKSVLEDLARSVEVRDEPSSKSFIF